MGKALFAVPLLLLALIVAVNRPPEVSTASAPPVPSAPKPTVLELKTVSGTVGKNDTLHDIFMRHNIDPLELHAVAVASRGVYDLRRLRPGKGFKLSLDGGGALHAFKYSINSDLEFIVSRDPGGGFAARTVAIPYETVLVHRSGRINNNLVSAVDDLLLALDLTDIFAWDIDFMTDLREGDTFRLVVEELRLDGEFVKYGKILSSEFINNGKPFRAYRFTQNGREDYFNSSGRNLRRPLLKAPLNYRRISSSYTNRRFHPVLKRYRPHRGVDYAAPRGTPVSSVGDGTVLSAGYKGQNGKQVVIRHKGGYTTYYGHLSRISRGIRRGAKIRQGQVIGRVGSTGLSTGPHLDYRVKKNGSFINPLRLKLPPGKPVVDTLYSDFIEFRNQMDEKLGSIGTPGPPAVKAVAEKG